MGRIYSDAEKLIKAQTLANNGHHRQAANIYRGMANEYRDPKQKDSLRKMADKSMSIHYSD